MAIHASIIARVSVSPRPWWNVLVAVGSEVREGGDGRFLQHADGPRSNGLGDKLSTDCRFICIL